MINLKCVWFLEMLILKYVHVHVSVLAFVGVVEKVGFENVFSLSECQRLKALVVQQIRANQQLEQDLYTMDIKIGLLVKNTISLEDVVSHSRQVNKNRTKGAKADGQDLVPSTGGFSKQTQAKIEVSLTLLCVSMWYTCICIWQCVVLYICVQSMYIPKKQYTLVVILDLRPQL